MPKTTVTPDPGQLKKFKAQMLENFSRFRTSNLVRTDPTSFQGHIESELSRVDPEIEGYSVDEVDRQRDLSVKFHWGHNHNFGDFALEGRMGDRHIDLMARFLALFPVSVADFQGASVLDVGCWTGGTTLLLSTLGAKVHAIEEVRKYVNMVQFLIRSFGLTDRVSAEPKSIYDCNEAAFQDRFDIVYFPGVIYHLSDPVLALRILFNALKPGGFILVESHGIEGDAPNCLFEGNFIYYTGTAEMKNRGGWNWFVPSPVALYRMLREAGFEEMQSYYVTGVKRVYAFARKLRQNPICRAGLSLRSIR
jgi:2-polyprenyl-3-methyl-5-hydroxy-6-metoxy-1,4-benzoquinol methylase